MIILQVGPGPWTLQSLPPWPSTLIWTPILIPPVMMLPNILCPTNVDGAFILFTLSTPFRVSRLVCHSECGELASTAGPQFIPANSSYIFSLFCLADVKRSSVTANHQYAVNARVQAVLAAGFRPKTELLSADCTYSLILSSYLVLYLRPP